MTPDHELLDALMQAFFWMGCANEDDLDDLMEAQMLVMAVLRKHGRSVGSDIGWLEDVMAVGKPSRSMN